MIGLLEPMKKCCLPIKIPMLKPVVKIVSGETNKMQRTVSVIKGLGNLLNPVSSIIVHVGLLASTC